MLRGRQGPARGRGAIFSCKSAESALFDNVVGKVQRASAVWRPFHSGGNERLHARIDRGLICAQPEEDDRRELSLQAAHGGPWRFPVRALTVMVLATP